MAGILRLALICYAKALPFRHILIPGTKALAMSIVTSRAVTYNDILVCIPKDYRFKLLLLVKIIMGRPRATRRSMFNVPKISRQIQKSQETQREITDEPIAIGTPSRKRLAENVSLDDITVGAKRRGLLQRLVERGRIQKSTHSFSELQQKKYFPNLVHTEVDCLDEAELRGKFPKQGTNHKFFLSGDYKYSFCLPCDSDSVVVAHISWNGKIRLSADLDI